ncbi:MAG: quinone-interacting membrane-bound oxidoreductase complex subunit QmoC [Desulfobacteraceae bacterium]|nr:quinone-interacting membrane-bound oxidoreductase complex subunit QmoC [Desulfobacteraceae bacterium]
MQINSDLQFIKYLKGAGGDTLKKCYQCATCSVVCPLSSDQKPFPRKEMIWAQWGLKDKLVADPDVFLCHQCGDCTAYCPRGAKPGDVLGAIRAYAYTYYGFPSGLAKLASSSSNLPILIGLPAAIILVLWYISGGMHLPEGTIDFGKFFGEWHFHYLSKTVFFIDAIMLPAAGLALFSAYKGVSALWAKMAAGLETKPGFRPSCPQFAKEFLWPAVQEIISHKRFNECGVNQDRVRGHKPLMLAFIGLLIVTTYGFIRKDLLGIFNPSLHGPIPLWDPIKILANVSAIALIYGILLLWGKRSNDESVSGSQGTFYDWFLIYEIAVVGISGLLSELTRLAHIGTLAYGFYFIHLVAIMMLFLYMPYTKFAHLVYRTFAMAFERYRQSDYVTKRA